MPEIARFYGIVVRMYFDDHFPPHFHAEYSGEEILVNIDTLGIVAGKLSPRAVGLVMEWAALHQDELHDLWRRARNLEPLYKVDPLP